MPSRRDVLLGTGAVLLLGAGAVVEAGGRRRQDLLHRLGLIASPDHSVPPSHTPVLSGQFTSTHMPNPIGWSLSIPPAPVTGVIYCLHPRGASHGFALDEIHLHDVAAALGARVAVAAVDGGADSYWHRRADGSDAQAMVFDDFVPLVESHIRAPARAILGWSMGGYGALLAAEAAPERFQVVSVASPALFLSPQATAPGAFDGPADYSEHNVFAQSARLDSLTVRVDCGTGDPFYAASKRFIASLARPPEGSFGPGFHDAAYWRSVAPAQIRTIQATFRRSIPA